MAKRANPRQMARLLARRERSGWSWAELARRSGVPVWTLRWWSRRLEARNDPPDTEKQFTPVRVVDPASSLAAPLELVLPSGVRLLVPPHFDSHDLRRVLEVMRTTC